MTPAASRPVSHLAGATTEPAATGVPGPAWQLGWSRSQNRRRDPRRGRRGTAGSGTADREAGSAVAEFVLVSTLVLFLGVGLFQLGLLLHVRNTVLACAAEGARAGARADATSADGVARTTWLVSQSLSATYGRQVTGRTARTSQGVDVIEVTVTAPTPVIGLVGSAGSFTVTGRAFAEVQVAPPAEAKVAPP